MDAGVQTLVMGVSAFLGLLFAALAFMNFRNFKKRSGLLKRAQEMTGGVNGRVSELVTVRRSNRSFRWKNEYPVVSYQVNGKEYTVSLDFAEKRKGSYSLGETYRVNYVPSDPSCCIVEEFRKQLESSRVRALAGMVVLCLFLFNIVFSLLTQ